MRLPRIGEFTPSEIMHRVPTPVDNLSGLSESLIHLVNVRASYNYHSGAKLVCVWSRSALHEQSYALNRKHIDRMIDRVTNMGESTHIGFYQIDVWYEDKNVPSAKLKYHPNDIQRMLADLRTIRMSGKFISKRKSPRRYSIYGTPVKPVTHPGYNSVIPRGIVMRIR